MRLERLALAIAWSALVLPSCTRPVTGREFAGAEIKDAKLVPENVKEGVPIAISFRLDGGAQGDVSYSIASRTFQCAPERLPDGRLQCTHPGVSRVDYTPGPTDITLRAKDRLGRESTV